MIKRWYAYAHLTRSLCGMVGLCVSNHPRTCLRETYRREIKGGQNDEGYRKSHLIDRAIRRRAPRLGAGARQQPTLRPRNLDTTQDRKPKLGACALFNSTILKLIQAEIIRKTHEALLYPMQEPSTCRSATSATRLDPAAHASKQMLRLQKCRRSVRTS